MAAPFVALFESAGAHAQDTSFCALTASCFVPDALAASNMPPHGGALTLPARIHQDIREFGQPWLLCLDESLPDRWRDFAWESLRLQGEPLDRLALVARKARPQFAHQEVRSPFRRSAVLNLFPRSEFDFRERLQPQIASERLTLIRPEQLGYGIDGFDELFVLAHGDERGLLDAEGRVLTPETTALPRRVWLVACNLDFEMYRVAERLLAVGVETVIAATGEISAVEMASLVSAWTERPPGTSLESWLLTGRDEPESAGGRKLLTLIGNVTIDDSPCALWNARTWTARRCSDTVQLRLSEDFADRTQFDAAREAIDRDGLWRESLNWLMPQVLAHAENLDHRLMLELLPRCETLSRESPGLLHALATAAYRCGHYDLMAKYVGQGLNCSVINEVERSDLLVDLTMLLIDMDLPRSALQVANAHERCNLDHGELRRRHEFKRLDLRARSAFKEGDFDQAIHWMKAKRRKNTEVGDTRELASLLYMQSWRDKRNALASDAGRDWSREVIGALAKIDAGTLGKGNDNGAYLLRALACYAWSTGDAVAISTLQAWAPTIRRELTSIDPGPWAFATVHLYLTGNETAGQLNLAITALEDAGYLSEAAVLADHCGLHDRSRIDLDRFLVRRQRTIEAVGSVDSIIAVDALQAEADARSGGAIVAI